MCPAKPDINIKCWLAIARQEKIDNLEKPNGYNSCDAQLWLWEEQVSIYFTYLSVSDYTFSASTLEVNLRQ